jgi:hypothetical protein
MKIKGNFGHPASYMGSAVAAYPRYFNELCKDLPKGMHVLDLFGGIGLLPSKMWDTLQPSAWDSVDVDPWCIENFREPRATAVEGNAFHHDTRADLVIIDPHKGTLNAISTDPEWILLLTNIAKSARFLLIQEYGAYWCHLPNQQKLYNDKFGVKPTRETYPALFSQYMTVFGYRLIEYNQGLGSTYYLFSTPYNFDNPWPPR